MSRTLQATVNVAVDKAATRPAYLLKLGLSTASPIGTTYAATWGSNIIWGGDTYLASGIEVRNLTPTGCLLEFPNGTSDPWLNLASTIGFRNRTIDIYQHYTDLTQSPQADAEYVFSGIMDETTVTDNIRVSVQERSRATAFPVESMAVGKFNFLLPSGSVIQWAGRDIVVR